MRHERTKHQKSRSAGKQFLVAIQQLTLAVMVGILVLPLNSPAQDIPFTFSNNDEMVDPLALPPREGDLDTSFSGDGILLTDFGGRDDSAFAIAIQFDGKIVVAGRSLSASSDFVLARYLPNGSLDGTFSGDGKVRSSFGGNEIAFALALQLDGRIVVAGEIRTSHGTDFLVARYLPNGTLDTTFSGNGWVVTNLGNNESAHAVALQPDGKVVVAGSSQDSRQSNFALVRYLPNGILDTTFNGTGSVITSFTDGGANDIALQPDGKIVVVGFGGTLESEDFDSFVIRYLPNGTLDSTFNGRGWVATNHGHHDDALAVALQPDGKIVVAGTRLAGSSGALSRYLPNGTLDTSFNGDGRVQIDFGGDEDDVRGLALQSDGKIVVAGSSSTVFGTRMALARFLTNGSLDFTFGVGGKVILDRGIDTATNASALAIQPRDGRLVAAGFGAGPIGTQDLSLARFHAITCNGVVVTRIGTAGNDTIIGTSGNDVIYAFGGNDFIDGLGGNDIICGGGGNDILEGGSGDDILSGGPGTDICRGEAHVLGDRASQCETVTTVP